MRFPLILLTTAVLASAKDYPWWTKGFKYGIGRGSHSTHARDFARRDEDAQPADAQYWCPKHPLYGSYTKYRAPNEMGEGGVGGDEVGT